MDSLADAAAIASSRDDIVKQISAQAATVKHNFESHKRSHTGE